jgi:glycosyltransferase involved in cell wall biosynthesis
MAPLVSVICLCYNHEQFVQEAIESVLNQNYTHIQLIVVDDFSSDRSTSIIEQLTKQHPQITFLQLNENVGNCAAFNKGLALASGEFIVDFATDDVMLPDRIQKQINHFSDLDQSYGVVFTNADYIDSAGNKLRSHTEHLIAKGLISQVPEGNVFRDVLIRYFICSPTMMIRKEGLDQIHGYDENLVYEDFDFWVRSSRTFMYSYLDIVTTKVRRSGNSMSSGWYELGDQQLHSTFLVCEKAISLCNDEEDRQALLSRVRYEFKQAIFSGNKMEAKLFGQLEAKLGGHNFQFYLFNLLSQMPLPWPWIRKKYHHLFYS